MASAETKLEDCEVCGKTKAKYTCPKCEVRTCSLMCVKCHKKELNCDGSRDTTKYIPLNSFTDLDLLSDYRFLETIGRTIDTKKRNPDKRCTHQNNLPMHLHKLRYAALSRNITLLFMPQVFSRHKENTTYLNWKTNELFWRIEWVFPQAGNIKWVMEKALDSTRLSTLVGQVVDPISVMGETDIEKLNLRLNLADKLQFYRATGLSYIKVLLKAERVKKASSRFYDLDFRLTLKQNLENKTIVEFPTLHVIMKDHLHMYEIIDTDEELSDMESTSHGPGKKRNNTKFNTKTKVDKPVNYFFTDIMESDDETVEGRKRTYDDL